MLQKNNKESGAFLLFLFAVYAEILQPMYNSIYFTNISPGYCYVSQFFLTSLAFVTDDAGSIGLCQVYGVLYSS